MTDAQRQAVLKLYGLEKLEDATRERWPWWDRRGPWSKNPHHWSLPPIALMPDLPNDDAAAVKLAERMRAAQVIYAVEPRHSNMARSRWYILDHQTTPTWSGPTLGAALLAALESAQ